MSIKPAKRFIERLKTDEEFTKRVAECNDTAERLAFLKKSGFEFSARQTRGGSTEPGDKNPVQATGDRKCYFQPELSCLRDFIQAACLCPVNRAYQKHRGV